MDAQNQEEQPKTTLDIEVQSLKQELADMRAKYEQEINEYKEANKGLYARLNTPQQTEQPIQEVPSWDTDKAADTVRRSLGLK